MRKTLAKYWLLGVLFVLIVAVVGMSRYAEKRKADNQENARSSSPQAAVTPNDATKGTDNADKAKHRPDVVDMFTWPEGATAWALFLTLIVIAWQSAETRAAADAAADSAEAAMRAARAWISVSLTQPAVDDMKNITERPNDWFTGIGVHFECIGDTPARVRSSKILAKLTDVIEDYTQTIKPKLPDEPDYEKGLEVVQSDTVWMPGQKYGYFAHLPRQFFPALTLEFDIGEQALCLYGFVEYWDAFEKKSHITRFCYVYQPFPPGSDLTDGDGKIMFSPEFRVGGPSAYNKTT
jgi:hypothetical protein